MAVLETIRFFIIYSIMAKKSAKEEQVKQEPIQTAAKASSRKKTASKKEPETEVKAGSKTKSEAKGEKIPTLAEQYKTLKEKHPDAVLLFRGGDFYHTVNEDAKKTSQILGITLTKPQDKSKGEFQASFPYHSLDTYLPKLVREGLRIAIVEEQTRKISEAVVPTKEAKKEQKVEEQKAEQKQVDKPVEAMKTEETKTEKAEKQHREPQMVTVNGEKVSHGHAYQSKQNPEDWFFVAKINGNELHPQKMSAEDLVAYQKKELSIEQLMQHYYPTKLMKQVTPEEYKAAVQISDGRSIEKMTVYKEKDQQSENYGKYMLYAQVGEKAKMSTVMSQQDLNAYFDRVMTPAQLVEKNFGERLGLKEAFVKYQLPEGSGIKEDNIRIGKLAKGEWFVSVDMGERGMTDKKTLSKEDQSAFFGLKTVSKEQLAAKYLMPEITEKMGMKQETKMGLKI